MSTFKIKIKCLGPEASRDAVLKVLNRHNVLCSKVHRANADLILVYCNSANDVDKVFTSEAVNDLSQLDCEPTAPPDLHAKRSIIVKRLDSFIYDQDAESIKRELERVNPWLKIRNLFKFPNSKTFKITCFNLDMVSRALSGGLLMFNLSISSNNISPEDFVNVMICYRCYKWNDHITESCSKASSYIICSLCSSTDHIYKNCKSECRKCINCGGGHSSISFGCPKRREIAKMLSVPLKHPGINISPKYSASSGISAASTRPTAQVNTGQGDNMFINKSIVKSAMCMIMSSLIKHENGNEYQLTLNQLLTANDLPEFNMGSVEPPLINIATDALSVKPPNLHGSGDDVPVDDVIQDARCGKGAAPIIETPAITTTDARGTQDGRYPNSVSKQQAGGCTASSSGNPESPVTAGIIKFSKTKGNSNISTQRNLRYNRKLAQT